MKHDLLNVLRSCAFVVTALLSTQPVVAQVPDHASSLLGGPLYCPIIYGSYRIMATPDIFDEYGDPNFYFAPPHPLDLTGTSGWSSPPHFGQARFFYLQVAWLGTDRVWHYRSGNNLAYYPDMGTIYQKQNGQWVDVLAAPLTLMEILDTSKLLRGLDQPREWSEVKVVYPGQYWYRGVYGWGATYDHFPTQPQELGPWTSYTWDQWRPVRCGV